MNDDKADNLDQAKKIINISSVIRVSDLALILNCPVTEVIKQLLSNGVLATINDSIDFETAAIISDDFGFEAVEDKSNEELLIDQDQEEGEVSSRAPIVTVMGHVDHGKTSLLDYIRKTKVAEGESGGITQHIGSYQIDYKGQIITFLDTPGHEAFSAIRAQGTKVTDVVVLVVAAEEGVKPQTIEAIKLAQAASVPIIVAVTKIDKPGADIEKVKQQLGEYGILTESWGGKVPLAAVSTKTGKGMDDLLTLINLTSEIAELTARQTGKAKGIIIEARHDVKIGQSATIIVRAGKLLVGDNFVVGGVYGKVKAMQDYNGKRIKEALPSMPVSITGFSAVPQVGDMLIVVDSEKIARTKAANNRISSTHRVVVTKSVLDALTDHIKAQKTKNLNVVIKADTQGSLQAIVDQLSLIKTDRGGSVIIISSGVGNINESDILSAQGSKAFVIGFKVNVSPGANQMSSKEKIKVITYDIIYELTDDLAKLLIESIGFEKVEDIEAEGEVLKIFRSTPKQKIIGVKVKKGTVHKDYLFRAYRGDSFVGEGVVIGIKLMIDDVETARDGDFGFLVEMSSKVKEGDRVEFVKVEHLKAKIIT